MSGNHSLSKVSCMYIHICTHIYKAPLCLFLYDTSVYLSGMQPIKKESEPQIIGDSKKQLKLETRVSTTTCCPRYRSYGDFQYHCKP